MKEYKLANAIRDAEAVRDTGELYDAGQRVVDFLNGFEAEVNKRVLEEHMKGTFVIETLNKMQEDLIKEYEAIQQERDERIEREAFEAGQEWNWSYTKRDDWEFEYKSFEDYKKSKGDK